MRFNALAGSSPLTRGKLAAAGVPIRLTGLIPAHAGKTLSGLRFVAYFGAHPRSRGENAIAAAAGVIGTGSSPLTRGKLDESLDEVFTCGLIPAHAGKTKGANNGTGRRGAHPRSRGENL